MSVSLPESQGQKAGQWGRAWEVSGVTTLSTFLIITTTPLMVFYFFIACTHYGGSLTAPLIGLWSGEITLATLWSQVPALSLDAFAIFGVWFLFQLVSYLFLPDVLHYFLPHYKGGTHLGSITPAGNRLSYQINGLQAWCLSHVVFFTCAWYFNLFSPTIIFDNWGGLLWVTNIFGNILALFVYIKANYFPTNQEDRKYSGNLLYDYYMGIEFNPRIKNFDFKLFFNGRPGIVAWTLINLSFMAAQYSMYGTITNSMILINILHAIYVLDFFWNEAWYLNTIDICHEHFGWMLSWGDSVWLPYMYTLQGLYLVYNPVEISTGYTLAILTLGVIGYWIFRSANSQKDLFRKSDGNTLIWRKKPEIIECEYLSADGKMRPSKLLVSGWWGVARHFNYTGDLMGCLAYGLACGFDHFIPYFYLVYMTILLVHRCIRDEHRMRYKYGQAWQEYCRRVPYRLIPGIF